MSDGRTLDSTALRRALEEPGSARGGEVVAAIPDLLREDRPRFVQVARPLFEAPDAFVRGEACHLIARLELHELADEIARLALADADAIVRADAVEALGDLGGSASVEVLHVAANDPDEDVRAYAALSIGLTGSDTDETWLSAWAAREPSDQVRAEVNAARARDRQHGGRAGPRGPCRRRRPRIG